MYLLKVPYYVPVLQKPEMKKPISKKDMTKEEIKKIHVNDFFRIHLKRKIKSVSISGLKLCSDALWFFFLLHTYFTVYWTILKLLYCKKKIFFLKFLSDFILTWLYNFNMLCVMYTIKNSLKHANLFNFAETASFGPITSGVVLQWNSVCQLWWRKTGPSSK